VPSAGTPLELAGKALRRNTKRLGELAGENLESGDERQLHQLRLAEVPAHARQTLVGDLEIVTRGPLAEFQCGLVPFASVGCPGSWGGSLVSRRDTGLHVGRFSVRFVPCVFIGSSVMRKVAASLFAIALSGCFSVPVAQQAMRFDSPGISSPGSPFCDETPEPSVYGANQDTGLDPDRIRVLTWNVHKGTNAGWLTDLAWFGAEHDLVLIQEARLSDPLRHVLHDDDLHWALAEAFRFVLSTRASSRRPE
jgi:hypothetical protein